MDNVTNERETHDFMNVDSFSQLPFLRPAPPSKEKPIRLFGQEFRDAPESNTSITDTFITSHDDNNNNNNNNVGASEDNTNNSESSRRFECHYCCRNFPTSQALGGHQNAHKRERQNAKRHLQGSSSTYGFMNYNRFGSTTAMSNFSYSSYNNPTLNNSNSSTATMIGGTGTGSFYGISTGSYSHHQLQPLNGSPLGLWRIPSANNTTTTSTITHHHAQTNPIFNPQRSLHPLPLLSREGMVNARMARSTSQNRFAYDSKPTVNDHVSLDLHL